MLGNECSRPPLSGTPLTTPSSSSSTPASTAGASSMTSGRPAKAGAEKNSAAAEHAERGAVARREAEAREGSDRHQSIREYEAGDEGREHERAEDFAAHAGDGEKQQRLSRGLGADAVQHADPERGARAVAHR